MSSLLSLAFSANEIVTKRGSCFYDESTGKGSFKEGQVNGADAWAYFEDLYDQQGWGKIHIYGNKDKPSLAQGYCAGYVDGYIMSKYIHMMARNYKANADKEMYDPETQKWNEKVIKFNQDNLDWFHKQIQDHPEELYWKRMAIINAQYEGHYQGVIDGGADEKSHPTVMEHWLLQAAGDNEDIETYYTKDWKNGHLTDPAWVDTHSHCTALIRLLDDNSDLFFSQNTWSGMSELHRYLKEYNLEIPEFKANHLMISSSTGTLASLDDFWVADTGLLVLETTMHVFAKSAYDAGMRSDAVFCWLRSLYSCWCCDSGKEWAETFIQHNSGTYNNEYIIVDKKKWTKGKEPTSDLIWLVDQLPAKTRQEDITAKFIENGKWWPGINTPYFEDMFKYADYPGEQERDPQRKLLWNYFDQPRYKIIQKYAPGIKTYEEFQKFMRFNDYQNEPLQINEPGQGIESRYDLRPETGGPLGPKSCFGGLDSKTCRLSEVFDDLKFDAILSPVYESQPAFNFRDWGEKAPSHEGMMDGPWQYNWTTFQTFNRCAIGGKTNEDCLALDGCGFCMVTRTCFPGTNKDHPNAPYSCEDGWRIKTETPSYAVPMVATITVLSVVFVASVFSIHYYQIFKAKKASGYEVIN